MAKINVNVNRGGGMPPQRIQVELLTFDHKQSRDNGKRIWSASVHIGTQTLRVIKYSDIKPDEYDAIFAVTSKNAPIVLSKEWIKNA
jgi:hypothetical protein